MTTTASATFKPDLRIIHVLFHIAAKYKRDYCYPSQDTIRALLLKWHGVVMPRRTLNRHLRGLQHLGYFRRIRRHTHDRHGALILKSTVYVLLTPAISLLRRMTAAAVKLSTDFVEKFHLSAVPKTAQKARLETLITNHMHKKVRKRTFW